jgi:hypothetical protein
LHNAHVGPDGVGHVVGPVREGGKTRDEDLQAQRDIALMRGWRLRSQKIFLPKK